MTTLDLPCLNELKVNSEDLKLDCKLDSESIEKILSELLVELNKSQDDLKLMREINLPKLDEIKREKRMIEGEILKIKKEMRELEEIKPLVILDKRRNDFKTEGEYINKILNRNIQDEFVNQMKRELKSQMNSFLESPETLDQTISTFPGCEDLNEKLDEKGIEGISICQKTEKFLSTISKCNFEIFKKVYPNVKDEEKCNLFKKFCCELIFEYFQKRIEKMTLTFNNTATSTSSTFKLPQFVSLILNDLIFSIFFIKLNYKNHPTTFLKSLRQKYFETFLNDQKDEISTLLFSPNCMKKIKIFMTRLEKVSSSTMLKSDFCNLKLNLLNFIHKLIWEKVRNLDEISEDEIEIFVNLIKESFEIGTLDDHQFLFFKPKLQETLKLLESSMFEIVNSFHRKEFKNLTAFELDELISSIFASSPLRNELLKEIRISKVDDSEEYF